MAPKPKPRRGRRTHEEIMQSVQRGLDIMAAHPHMSKIKVAQEAGIDYITFKRHLLNKTPTAITGLYGHRVEAAVQELKAALQEQITAEIMGKLQSKIQAPSDEKEKSA